LSQHVAMTMRHDYGPSPGCHQLLSADEQRQIGDLALHVRERGLDARAFRGARRVSHYRFVRW